MTLTLRPLIAVLAPLSVFILFGLPPCPAFAQNYRAPFADQHWGYFYPTAYKDHSGVDWACGNIRYSGHTGSDFGGGSWAGMNAGRNIVAAAEGVVTARNDGEWDQCSSGSCAPGNGNYVKIRHPNGRTTIYLHMKTWSVAVQVGQNVSCGQHLGQMGSSGYSTGPHLHFGVYQPSGSVTDPFDGPCSGPPSYWVSQGPHGGRPGLVCEGPADGDGDGWPANNDCDDGNASIHPGAPEICDDGRDNDCTGGDAQATPAYLDGDGDAVGGVATTVCGGLPGGVVLVGGDCDDQDASVYPGGTEVCDGRDNDCDGVIDDGDGLAMGSPPPEWAARREDASWPGSLPAGSGGDGWVAFRNVGGAPWGAGSLHLASRAAEEGQRPPLLDEERWMAWDVAARLDAAVLPGEIAILRVPLRAPPLEGTRAVDRLHLVGDAGDSLLCPSPWLDLDVLVTAASPAVEAPVAAADEGAGCRQSGGSIPGWWLLLLPFLRRRLRPRASLLGLAVFGPLVVGCPSASELPPPAEDSAVVLHFVDRSAATLQDLRPLAGGVVRAGDLDGDGDADLVEAGAFGVRLLLGGGGSLVAGDPAALPIEAGAPAFDVALADLDGDDRRDLVLSRGAAGDLVLLQGPAGRFVLGPPLPEGSRVVGARDLDGDGHPDLVFLREAPVDGEPTVVVLRGDGAGAFAVSWQAPLDGDPVGLSLGDLDGDGRIDLFLTTNPGGPRLWVGDGAGAFLLAAPSALPATGSGTCGRPALGDLDGDGDLDVYLPSSGRDRLWINDRGVLVDHTELALGADSTDDRVAELRDLDRDGVIDVVVVGAGPLRILRGDGQGRFYDYSAALAGLADPAAFGGLDGVGLAVADLDGDSVLDLVLSRDRVRRLLVLLHTTAASSGNDPDGDGVPSGLDGCPDVANGAQLDRDGWPFACLGAVDCAAQTGCTVAAGAASTDSVYLLCPAQPRGWQEARAFCVARGADLVVVDTAEENALLLALAPGGGWLGLSDLEEEGAFRWVDGSAPMAGAFAEGEPNDSGGVEDCGQIVASGLWNDLACDFALPPLCERTAANLLDDPPDACDNCPWVLNLDQADTDGDGLGDLCDPE